LEQKETKKKQKINMKEEKFRCEECYRVFGGKESLENHNAAKHSSNILEENKSEKINRKKIRNRAIAVLIIGLIFYGIFWMFSNIKVLPPTDMQRHIEANPPSHVLKKPMPVEIQKHMLEHADGTGKPGVVINYNCEDYDCESDLIEKLEAFSEKYNYVYVAPFKNMDAKIVLTRLNKIEILEFYDETGIESFINGF